MTAASSIADSIRRGLNEALAYAEGPADQTFYKVHIPVSIDVKAIRTRLGLTQQRFAARFGFNINTCDTGSRAAASQKAPPAPISSSSIANPKPS